MYWSQLDDPLYSLYTFEGVGTWLILLGFKMRRINLEICFATLSELTMMLGFVRIIVLDTSRSLKIARKHCVAPLLAVFALGHTRVYIGTPNSCNETSYIKASIDDFFCRQTVL